MRSRFALAVLVLSALSCPAQTLKELLAANHIPPAAVGQLDLSEHVQGVGKSNQGEAVVAYQLLDGERLVGSPRLLKYEKAGGTVIRAELHMDETDVCSGSVGEIYFIDEFTLLSTDLSPSAECLLVLDKNLELKKMLYGFASTEVAPGKILIVEDMIHFVPVHPERLQLADLRSGITTELYPPKDDALREQLMTEHEKHMPAKEVCMRMNDPCEPDKFDEEIDSLATDGKGRFAFLADQFANHVLIEGQPSETSVAQTVFYMYQKTTGGWIYCEDEVDDFETEALRKDLKGGLEKVPERCTPSLPVAGDMSAADYNPFMRK